MDNVTLPISSSPSLPSTINTPTALIVVDMQKEFFTPSGMFKNKHLLHESIVLAISPFLSLFRSYSLLSLSSLIVWVRSEYLNNSPSFIIPPDFTHSQKLHSLIHRTHTGKRACCSPSSPLLSFIPAIENLILSQDLILTKNNYSSFNNTCLDEELKKREIEKIIICGVTANTCVFATAMHAKQLGYKEVIVLRDCVGFSSEKYALLAYSELENLGISVVNSTDIQLQ